MKKIYVVTHGDKFPGPNPGHTPTGNQEVAALRPLLPETPPAVVCGTGRRHSDVAEALGLEPTRFTCLAGDPDSLEIIEGVKMAILADGHTFPLERHTSLADMSPVARSTVVELPDQSVICGGRPAMIMLGYAAARSAAVYRVSVDGGEIVAIDEVVATGEQDPALA
jgi:hypothetical protein